MDRPFTVLLVEDDEDVAELVRQILITRAGMRVEVVMDPSVAYDLLIAGDFDVLLTDIQLPGGSGLELAARVRARLADLPIAVMTAHASVDYAVAALRSQADEFLIKPVPASTLIATVTRLAQAHRDRVAAVAGKVVLAVGAHPDDVEIGVGGLLHAHRAAGDSVVILTLSRGSSGGDPGARQHESLAAADLLGARLFLKDEPDTVIAQGNPTVGIIEEVIREVSPDIVYTHTSNDRHQDHRAVHQATLVAARRVPTLACYQSPSSTIQFSPNRFAPIDRFVDDKLALLACFASQAGIRDYLEPDFVIATARYWSRFGGGANSCEPLEVVRDSSAPQGAAEGSQPARLRPPAVS